MVYDLEDVAIRIFLNKIKNEEDFSDLGWEFRKNKGIPDINKAMKKSLNIKKTHAKFEMEISMLAVYLNDILKKRKQKII
jgi:hypothetical protein